MFFKNKLKNKGVCPICEIEVNFIAKQSWLRDFYICTNCGSIPRERALMETIKTNYPNWKQAVIHETSPGNRGTSVRLQNECKEYIPSQYFKDRPLGTVKKGIRCENLESLTFEDNSIDLHISQDVMEHVFDPAKAFSEIARTLKPGGMHIFTVPLVNKANPSVRRAKIDNENNIVHFEKPSYHGSPIGDGKSLVTIDWGYDICDHIFQSSGLFTRIIYIDNIEKGIRAEYIEVLITQKNQKKISVSDL